MPCLSGLGLASAWAASHKLGCISCSSHCTVAGGEAQRGHCNSRGNQVKPMLIPAHVTSPAVAPHDMLTSLGWGPHHRPGLEKTESQCASLRGEVFPVCLHSVARHQCAYTKPSHVTKEASTTVNNWGSIGLQKIKSEHINRRIFCLMLGQTHWTFSKPNCHAPSHQLMVVWSPSHERSPRNKQVVWLFQHLPTGRGGSEQVASCGSPDTLVLPSLSGRNICMFSLMAHCT